MNTELLGKIAGSLLVVAVTLFFAFAATVFVTGEWHARDWSPAGRLIFLGATLFTWPKLFHAK